jgi:triacylglycerol lipase
MPIRSRLAWLLQAVLAVQIVAAAAWVVHSAGQPLRAIAGAVAILFFYAFFFALEYVLLAWLARADPAPRATLGEMLRAWWHETLSVPRVFGWRLPFAWRAEPDHLPPQAQGKRGAVFIHGFICNRGFWTPWLKVLRREGRAFVAVNLEPVFGSIDDYAALIDAAVRDVRRATGLPPVLVCHSMGGLAARAWLRSAEEAASVHQVITIGSPHRGTWLGRFSHVANGRQMRQGSVWLEQLERDEAARHRPPFVCWYSNCDNIVMPPSTATLPHADNRLVRGAAHVDLAFHPRVMADSLGRVTG